MESLVSSVTFLRDFIVDKTSCQCPPFAHQRGQELNSSFSCEHNEETLTWYPCTLANKWGSRNFPKYQCPYFHADTDMAAPCCMVLYPFTSVHFTSYLFWGSPHFYLPFWALGSMVAFAAGPCKQSHLHRNWWSLPTNSSLKKTHHILPSFGGAVIKQNTSLHQLRWTAKVWRIRVQTSNLPLLQGSCRCLSLLQVPCVFPLGL